jgi:hypothetical protein
MNRSIQPPAGVPIPIGLRCLKLNCFYLVKSKRWLDNIFISSSWTEKFSPRNCWYFVCKIFSPHTRTICRHSSNSRPTLCVCIIPKRPLIRIKFVWKLGYYYHYCSPCHDMDDMENTVKISLPFWNPGKSTRCTGMVYCDRIRIDDLMTAFSN